MFIPVWGNRGSSHVSGKGLLTVTAGRSTSRRSRPGPWEEGKLSPEGSLREEGGAWYQSLKEAGILGSPGLRKGASHPKTPLPALSGQVSPA